MRERVQAGNVRICDIVSRFKKKKKKGVTFGQHQISLCFFPFFSGKTDRVISINHVSHRLHTRFVKRHRLTSPILLHLGCPALVCV